MVIKKISMFRTAEHFFRLDELSRVNLYRDDLKGNKNYFELARGSSYRESTVQSTPDNSNLQAKSKKGSSYREFEENSREYGKKQFLPHSEHLNHI